MPKRPWLYYGSEGCRFNSYWVRHLRKQELTKTLRSPVNSPMANKLQKVEGEDLLFIHPPTKIYYLRKRDKVSDTHVSLKTTKISVARGLRDDYVAARRARALGLAAPEPPPKEKPKEARGHHSRLPGALQGRRIPG